LKSQGVEEVAKPKVDMKVGEQVRITSGAFENWSGAVTEIHADRGKLKVLVNLFGRETPVELDFSQVEKAL